MKPQLNSPKKLLYIIKTPIRSSKNLSPRLKLATEMGREQSDTLFVFDESTIGLHPLDVIKLIEVFQRLIELGATILVIEHDLDVIRNADYIIDMGPGGGQDGGRIVESAVPALRDCGSMYKIIRNLNN